MSDEAQEEKIAAAVRLVAAVSRCVGLEGSLVLSRANIKDDASPHALFAAEDRTTINIKLKDALSFCAGDFKPCNSGRLDFCVTEPDGRADRSGLLIYRMDFVVGKEIVLSKEEKNSLNDINLNALSNYDVLQFDYGKETIDRIKPEIKRVKERITHHLLFLTEAGMVEDAYCSDGDWMLRDVRKKSARLCCTVAIEHVFAFKKPVARNDIYLRNAINKLFTIGKYEEAEDYRSTDFFYIFPGDVGGGMQCHLDNISWGQQPSTLCTADPEHLIGEAAAFQRARYDIPTYRRMAKRRRGEDREASETLWLVRDLIARGEVTLLAGDGGVGKSTLAHELLAAAGTPLGDGAPPCQWLGRDVARGAGGVAVLLTMEESELQIVQRSERLDPGRVSQDFMPMPCETKSALLEFLRSEDEPMPDDSRTLLLVVDSASRFIEGSPLNDADVNAFYEPLTRFARKTGAAVMVIHHLNKVQRGEKPIRTAEDFRARVGGNAAFVNNPRMVIGMFRDERHGLTKIGVAKQNLGLEGAEGEWQSYRRDPNTYRHIPVGEGDALVRSRSAGASLELTATDRVMAALSRLLGEGVQVTVTGGKGLWERRAPELEGIGRDTLRKIVRGLIEDGRISQGADGVLTLSRTGAGLD